MERRIADRLRALEARAALAAEFPGMRRHLLLDECDGPDGWCDDCLRWSDVQLLNARINRRAVERAA